MAGSMEEIQREPSPAQLRPPHPRTQSSRAASRTSAQPVESLCDANRKSDSFMQLSTSRLPHASSNQSAATDQWRSGRNRPMRPQPPGVVLIDTSSKKHDTPIDRFARNLVRYRLSVGPKEHLLRGTLPPPRRPSASSPPCSSIVRAHNAQENIRLAHIDPISPCAPARNSSGTSSSRNE